MLHNDLITRALQTRRVFKTAWFSKEARKAGITDDELREAIQQVIVGRAGDRGGGVFKKRLNKNSHRGIVLARGGRKWVFASLFAKRDRANIDADELADFRRLAKSYQKLTERQIGMLLIDRDFVEITGDDQAQV